VQLVRVVSGASQPSVASLLQSPYPALQATEHFPPLQVAVPFVLEQRCPQAPQLFTSVWVLVSHPLLALPSQSPRPALQVETPHTPATQFGVPPVVEHLLPHAEQLSESVLMFVSHPLSGLPSQSA
jgi:hypothetical protein